MMRRGIPMASRGPVGPPGPGGIGSVTDGATVDLTLTLGDLTAEVNTVPAYAWTGVHSFKGVGTASVSTGGSVLVNPDAGTGAGLIAYSNRGADAAGRLMHVFQDNPLNPQTAFRVVNDGTGISSQIQGTNVAGNEVLDVLGNSLTTTVVGIQGDNNSQGVVKLTHNHPATEASGSDANAAVLRLNWEAPGAPTTAAQMIYAYSEDGSPTTGDLIEIYNGSSVAGNLKMLLEPAGRLVLPRNADEEVLRVGNTVGAGANAATVNFFGPPVAAVTGRRTLGVQRVYQNAVSPGVFTPALSVSATWDSAVSPAGPFSAEVAAGHFLGTIGKGAYNPTTGLGARAPVNLSGNMIGSRADVYGVLDAQNEWSYFQGVTKDWTAAGLPHISAWGQDLGVIGHPGEQQRMLHNISSHVLNYFDGQPTAADSMHISLYTSKDGGPDPFLGQNNYPLYAGIGLGGISTNAGGPGKAYGMYYGWKVGQIRTAWGQNTKVEFGGGLWDWGQYGLEVGDRYAGAAETDPWGIWINPLFGISVGGFVATRHQTLALVNGVNANIPVTQSLVLITGPTAAFSITSVAPSAYSAPLDGMRVTIINKTAFAMTITNGTATPQGIVTSTNANLVGTATNQSTVELVYDSVTSRWREVGWRP